MLHLGARAEPRMGRDHRVHFMKDLARLEAIVGAGVNLAVRLPLRAAEVAQRQSRRQECLALLLGSENTAVRTGRRPALSSR